MTATTIVIRIIAFLAVILGMTVLAVCGWAMAITIINEEIETSPESNFTSVGNSSGSGTNYTVFVLEDDLTEDPKHLEDKNTMTRKFKYLIQACIGSSICVTLAQLTISMIILCTFNKTSRGKLRLWQLSHFIIILLLLMCILVPLSYNREKDVFRGTVSFGKYMKTEITNFYKMIVEQRQSFVSFFMSSLNSFYIVICANVFFLIIFLFLSCCTKCCCCCRCCCRRERGRTNVLRIELSLKQGRLENLPLRCYRFNFTIQLKNFSNSAETVNSSGHIKLITRRQPEIIAKNYDLSISELKI